MAGVADASEHLCLTFHSCFVVFLLFSFLPLGWVIFSLSVDLIGTSSVSQFRTLFGAWGQPGLGSLFWGYACDLFYFFPFLFRCVLDLFPFNRLKATHCPGQYLFWGHSSALYHTGSPSLCWPHASSGFSSIPTWFSRLCVLAFLRPKLGPLGFPSPNTLTTGTWVSFLSLPFGWVRIHLSSEPWQQLTSCVTCSLRRVILLARTSRSPPLRLACVFSVSYVTRSVKLSSFPQIKGTSLRRLGRIFSRPLSLAFKTLKRFSGKVISFSLAIPGSKLYVREVFKAVSRHSGS